MAKVFAIDLGATSAKCAFFIDDEVVANFNYDTTRRENLLENIAKKATEIAKENNIIMDEVDFVGIAVCGIVDNLKGSVVYSANLGWKDYPTREELKRIFKNENIVVLNDAKSATYGEWSKGLKEEPDSMALFTIGTGVGGGAIFNRKLVFGDNTGFPSEPGHGGGFQDEVQCICGLKGCIEPVSSATGIEKKLNEVAKNSTGKLGKVYNELNRVIHIKDIAFLVQENDSEVMEIFNSCLEPLAKCISVLIHFFDISMIVIGGGPSNLGDPLIKIIREKLKNYVLPEFYKRLNLRKAILGDLVGAWGVYQYGKNYLLKK
ncbi:ROK family protein [Spiroplasma taiwanense]|uniref:Glucokinase n=1 Tax=Spiroplasma taiwanense CT-1 TaxID=1276220 RepID=S5LT76_9MOLU|nr:ROK family protein [Spiroplasma taiwanense]AGR40899.1 glucokinase [Spiroplasma taiwanense CT-1]